MWRQRVVVAAVLTCVLAAAGPAAAGQRSTGAWADVTDVRPEFIRVGVDSGGGFCEYRAAVTLSWKGRITLWVSQIVDGVSHGDAAIELTGSGKKVTVIVPGVRVVDTGPLIAEALSVYLNRSLVLDSAQSPEPVRCPTA